ncbi:hypothetical protein BF49_4466 [Bradyrhizobium sp.]|nr:hypothetical protein BF49_4466 [Bradyrhizobium sp.]
METRLSGGGRIIACSTITLSESRRTGRRIRPHLDFDRCPAKAGLDADEASVPSAFQIAVGQQVAPDFEAFA